MYIFIGEAKMKIITADKWRNMETFDVLNSIELAVRVLKDRKLGREEKMFCLELIKEIADLVKGDQQ
jgi:hypothetical protein